MAKGTIALGQFRGKVGGQVLRVVEGQQVIQNYQPVVRNPRTTAQQMQRAAMAELGRAARALRSVLPITFGGSYATAAFVKKNISRQSGAISVTTPEDVSINYSSILLSEDSAGGLLTIMGGSVVYGTAQHLRIDVPVASLAISPDIDPTNVRLYAIAWCPDRKLAVMSDPFATTVSDIKITCPADWDGMDVHVWVVATAAMNDIDPDAYDTINLRLPTIKSYASYCGQGELA